MKNTKKILNQSVEKTICYYEKLGYSKTEAQNFYSMFWGSFLNEDFSKSSTLEKYLNLYLSDVPSISKGNKKTGFIRSFDLPPVLTCLNCGCTKKCYAKKNYRAYYQSRAAYNRNYRLLIEEPEKIYKTLDYEMSVNRFFRLHVSGDLINYDYLKNLVRIVSNNPHCTVLMFTKRHGLVNRYIKEFGSIPSNFKIVFSAWEGLPIINPFNLPEAHIEYKNHTTTLTSNFEKVYKCSGFCGDCACGGSGCFSLNNGEKVLFNEH